MFWVQHLRLYYTQLQGYLGVLPQCGVVSYVMARAYQVHCTDVEGGGDKGGVRSYCFS